MDKEEIISDAVKIIRRHLPAREFEIVLFGSWVRGNAHATSDIDLGLAGPNPVDDLILSRIKREIESIPTLRRIDIVDLSKADDRFRREVLSYARPL
ncbi:MAG TPA: nucleotidyltransferase domain-containing protein [Terriglobia bacterium]|nr:nucleotidyltransferase domain-containing protein [Terriglobia bacterium]